MSDIQFIILTGGKGTRLYPISKDVPKPLVRVCGKPFLAYLIDHIKAMGFENITLLSGYLAEQIDFFCQQYNPPIKNIVENVPLGTGGAIKAALDSIEDRFVLINGDTFLPGLTKENILEHSDHKLNYIFTCDEALVDELPNIELGMNNEVISYGNSKKSRRVDSGVYILNKKYFEKYTASDNFSLSEVYRLMIEDKKLFSIKINNKYYDMGTPDRLKIFENYIKGK